MRARLAIPARERLYSVVEKTSNFLAMKLAYRLVLIASNTRSQSVSAVRGVFLCPVFLDEQGVESSDDTTDMALK